MSENNIALLIDVDNVSAKYVKSIFDELNAFGTVSIRRIYGNWKRTYGWNEDMLLEYSIQPIQQFDYTKGKNATDMAMVIDAMDMLYTHNIDVFCIVTSDSDFTKLAMRLRESQAYVIGMGESKTPLALTKACNKFVHLDLIASDEPKIENIAETVPNGKNAEPPETLESNVTPISQIQESILNMIAESDYLTLGEVGSSLGKLFTDFDVRNYGYTKLNVFIREEFPKIHIEEKDGSFFVKMKNDVDITTVTREIIEFITKNGGVVENLSKIHEALKTNHKHFNIHDYGFSRFSSFLRSIDEISVDGNKVKLKRKTRKRT
ncbi:NYN domain-containing protein [Acetobacterium fimetarium]|uniref:NYN domain-containing protein n=1 Tax=Acetobacterium fimetarium TaxID=52691 RepID=A0ABR6WUR5_9FIRM|nr:NYN domain-containing protein [Acetobacterium fimetarium]MBC3803954.1 NYN domain-containing protein [Acetobacterium fimetarium]